MGIKSNMLRSLSITYKLTALQDTESRIGCIGGIWDYNLGKSFLKLFFDPS